MTKKTKATVKTTEAVIEEATEVTRVTKELLADAKSMSIDRLRYVVKKYYLHQERRKGADNHDRQERANNKLMGTADDGAIEGWFSVNDRIVEKQTNRLLEAYASIDPICIWMKANDGIGALIACALRANIVIEMAPTAGHIYSFVGYNPDKKWGKGQKRPWSSFMKTQCWKIGQSFMKLPDSHYGKLYRERKAYEVARNDAGGNAEAAAKALEEKVFDKSTDTYKHLTGTMAATKAKRRPSKKNGHDEEALEQKECSACLALGPGVGHLPPAQIDARARRWAVKLFLSHLQQVWYFHHYGKMAPAEYPKDVLGHAHIFDPQHTNLIPGFDKARAKGRREDRHHRSVTEPSHFS